MDLCRLCDEPVANLTDHVEDDHDAEDFEYADLSGTNLRHADLSKVDFRGADLSGTNLRHADLSEAYLGEADLSGAYVGDADLSGANLLDATLAGVDLRTATLAGANFRRADLPGAYLGEAVLSGANLRDANLSEAYLEDADLSGANLRDANLSEANLRRADLSEADLSGAELDGANLTQADLLGANLTGTDLSDVSLSRGTRVELDAAEAGRMASESEEGARDWDAAARVMNALRAAYSETGLVGRARTYRVRERKARRKEAFAMGGPSGYTAWIGSWLSRILTGYGVQLRWTGTVIVTLYLLSTGVYLWEGMGIRESVYYSVVTFTTAPPTPPPGGFGTELVALVETFGGTVLIVLLGYVLGTRERA